MLFVIGEWSMLCCLLLGSGVFESFLLSLFVKSCQLLTGFPSLERLLCVVSSSMSCVSIYHTPFGIATHFVVFDDTDWLQIERMLLVGTGSGLLVLLREWC